MGNYEAWSENKKYGLRIPEKMVQKILQFCKNAGDIETGGILVGYYNRRHDCAIVTDCSAPPKDSQHGKHRFYRGIRGLQKWLVKLWHLGQKQYYLGEWHFHPLTVPNPSSIDINQLKSNAESKTYHCPEPIIFIIGGDPDGKWSCKSLTYIKDKGIVEMFKQWESI